MCLHSQTVRQGKNGCNSPSASSGCDSFKSRDHKDSSVFLFSDNVEQPFEDENEASAIRPVRWTEKTLIMTIYTWTRTIINY